GKGTTARLQVALVGATGDVALAGQGEGTRRGGGLGRRRLPRLSVAGLPVTGLPVTGLPVTGLPVAGLPVAGLSVAGLAAGLAVDRVTVLVVAGRLPLVAGGVLGLAITGCDGKKGKE